MSHPGYAAAPALSIDTVCNSCGHPLMLLPRIDPPDTVGPEGAANFQSHQLVPGILLAGRYRILNLVGHGGMGEVYRAEDLTLEQTVALKFFPKRLQADHTARTRFYREVRLARQISHPNVCRVFDIGEAEGLTFITMEFVGGEDLHALLARIGRLAHDKALEVARQLCAGLAAAHGEGVLHRDLKPANIMLDRRGNVRITDFGLAGLAGEVGAPADVGTPIYMAPEQLRGEEVSVRTDLYALGLVLYEIFTGKRPFSMESTAEVARSRQVMRPMPSGKLGPMLERVILQCLDLNPAKRPRSAMDVASALPVAFLAAAKVEPARVRTEKLLDRFVRIGWPVFVISLGLAILVTLARQSTRFGLELFNHDPASSLSVLFIWVWCIALQSLMTYLSVGYLVQRVKAPKGEV